MVEKKREENKPKTLSQKEKKEKKRRKKKEEARNVSEQRDKGWIHVIRVHNTEQKTLTNYPTQRKNERFVKHRDYPLTRTS